MNSLQKIKKVLILGSGGLRIGQAGEFDYSGSQAIKAFKEEGIAVILLNPNIATVQTDTDMADIVYSYPLTLPYVEKILEKEKPDTLFVSVGGQTALNLGLALDKSGLLEKHHVHILGTSLDFVRIAEDRALFKAHLEKIEVCTAKSQAVHSVEDALAVAEHIGYPVMIRSGFSLGGLGSGVVHNGTELRLRAQAALNAAPQLLIEECLLGWTEIEYEIMRDMDGNAITICNMENMDPVGIHTGESIVVSPSQSLDNDEYHALRQIAIRVAEHLHIVGECNIQYAYHLKTREYRVIEVNPRLSRSSALASKATGYPIAFVATKIALGHRLHEIQNSITQKTCAFFEPALDYVVVKIPRWDTNKLLSADRHIGTEMKSVGEVMAIGRSFEEALQKAVGMLNIGATDLSNYPFVIEGLESEIQFATDRRLFALYQFFRDGGTVEKAHQLSQIDPWFLFHLQRIATFEEVIRKNSLAFDWLKTAKQLGFSDRGIANLKGLSEEDIRSFRLQSDIKPVIKRIDTLAGEVDAKTNYLYLTYHGTTHDVVPSEYPAVVVLGSGPYCIGSSVEFDWCGVTTLRTLKKLGETAIVINSNPETVSTDYDESDRLYFEQLTLERVRDIADFESVKGLVVSVGGQIANNLAIPLAQHGYPLLGSSAETITSCENREIFSALLNTLNIDQPPWESAANLDRVKAFANKIEYPVLVRPSFVLSGAAMKVVSTEEELEKFIAQAVLISKEYPVVVSKFISDAKEIEIDGVAEAGKIVIDALSEHIENAGVHSGDATIVLPPQRLYLETIRRTKKIARKIVKELKVTGPFNIQFIAKNNAVQVIECNLRASRSFPFVSKTTNHNFIEIATRIMLKKYIPQKYETLALDYIGVKTPQFSYSRLKGSNPVAHVEMASTGEVACLGENLLEAFYLSWQASDLEVRGKRIFISLNAEIKSRLLEPIRQLSKQGWEIFATEGTSDYLASNGIPTRCVYKASEKLEPNVTTIIVNHQVDLIVNIPSRTHVNNEQQTDGFVLRRLAIDHHIPLITNAQTTQVLLECLVHFEKKPISVRSWSSYTTREESL